MNPSKWYEKKGKTMPRKKVSVRCNGEDERGEKARFLLRGHTRRVQSSADGESGGVSEREHREGFFNGGTAKSEDVCGAEVGVVDEFEGR